MYLIGEIIIISNGMNYVHEGVWDLGTAKLKSTGHSVHEQTSLTSSYLLEHEDGSPAVDNTITIV